MATSDHAQDLRSLDYHRNAAGKVKIVTTQPITTREELSLTYTPGVALPAQAIANDPTQVWDLTGRRNRVAIVSDGSAVLGLGNIGPLAALPVMEGKAALMKEFADIDAFPICLNTQDTEEIVQTVKAIAPSFGGINLEDISAPRCFKIEELLNSTLDIPVFHDDQHGTAVVVLAGIINALKVTGKERTATIVISGAGAAGVAITRILLAQGFSNITVTDSHGIISRTRGDLNSEAKTFLAAVTNPKGLDGSLAEALCDADGFIGVSAPNIVTSEMVKSMADDPIIFALANPIPEIMPDLAKSAGAALVASGRSDAPNQVNNLLAFPGIFRGALDGGAHSITEEMKLAAANALAACVPSPSAEKILPDPLDKSVVPNVASAVQAALAP